jgi:methionyl-tRNA formyltransferase
MNLLFLGTSAFAVPSLRALAKTGKISAVVTQPDHGAGRGLRLRPSPVKQAALEMGLPLLQPENIGGAASQAALQQISADLYVAVAYGQLLPPAILEIPGQGCINLHASLLPAYRGAAPIQRAIMAGETRTGITTMWLSEGLDEGDIILQQSVDIAPQETYGELHDRLAAAGTELLLQTLTAVKQDAAPRRKQESAQASYAPALKPEETRVNWRQNGEQINNLIRALNPKPGAYCLWRGKRLKLWRGEIVSGGEGIPGQLVEISRGGPIVATCRDRLRLVQLQPEGRKAISGDEFARGYRLEAGESFG